MGILGGGYLRAGTVTISLLLKGLDTYVRFEMIGKTVYLLVWLVSIILVTNAVPGHYFAIPRAANNTNRSHDFIIGARVRDDRLVLKQSVIKSSAWQYVTVQQTFNVSRYEKITQLRALDQKTNGNGATATLVQGGPGTSYATLLFKSQRGHGINFVVELYAQPEKPSTIRSFRFQFN